MKTTKRALPSALSPDSSTETLASIGPVARSSVVDAVSDRLRNEILAGRLAPGSRLPSERELSLALGVNRLTLRAALARLEALGLVSTRHGSGTEVASWRERAGLEALPMVMSSLDPNEPAWAELLTSLFEIRRILSAEAVALAAVRHTPEDLASMQRIASDQAGRLGDALAYARGDLTFQRALVRAAGNVGFELILNSFARFPDEQPELVARMYDNRHEAVAYYGALIEVVRAGDPEAARVTVREALAAIDEQWLVRHGYRAAKSRTPVAPKTSARSARKSHARTSKGK
jgi:GntR family transcriptional regulator, transcriptional repressor for pyruvate dehydrogenase complex